MNSMLTGECIEGIQSVQFMDPGFSQMTAVSTRSSVPGENSIGNTNELNTKNDKENIQKEDSTFLLENRTKTTDLSAVQTEQSSLQCPLSSLESSFLENKCGRDDSSMSLHESPSMNINKVLFKDRPSLLSSDSQSSRGYRGLLNLAIILLVLTNLRLMLLNLMKYGILLHLEPLLINEWYRWPGLLIGIGLNFFIWIAYTIELLSMKDWLSDMNLVFAHSVNILFLVTIPSLGVWFIKPNPVSGILVMLCVSVLAMKLISYAHVNSQLRIAAKKIQSASGTSNPSINEKGWPSNLNLKNIYYFICAPTLCYRPEYPRTTKIRVGFLIRRSTEAIFLSLLIFAIVEQYIVPLVHNSLASLNNNDILQITERLLKLCIPNLFVWLMGFYVFFHLYLNIIAELCLFADRLFYRDWWNATSLSFFWKNWNLPVHNWMVEHVYTPLRGFGFSKNQCAFLCFLVSAFFHEIVIGIPFQMLKMWAFLGMMLQLPAIYLTDHIKGNQLGNVLFWFSIVLGQPFLVLMIYRDWYQRNFTDITS